MPSITPCLWFDNQAEEAANFYISVFGSGRYSESKGTSRDRPPECRQAR